MTTYAISAVTGRYGKVALQQLLSNIQRGVGIADSGKDSVIALARNVDKASASVPQGVEVRAADYSDPAQMVTALKGVDRLLFVSSQPGAAVPRLRQHQNVIDAAQKDGVSYIAYTSFAKADSAKSPLAEDHQGTEKALKASGIRHSFLRNAWYLENDMAVFKGAAAGRPLVYSAGEGRVSWASEKDYAQAGANVLVEAEPAEVYEFGGTPRTFAQMAQEVEKVTGKHVDVKAVDDAGYEQALKDSGMDEGLAQVLTSFQTMMRAGELDVDSPDLENALGHAPEPMSEALKNAIA
ncbi:MAG: NAD(P)H-binding protein [Bifidobacteriaceae bacterium]|jgi:NAD(P)H dehydrogenase (quinone)|nr:NAD(P)H-binding protein [Bifidobacteriaceae bacterium]MCI1914822.1 NAD(P)H-binding protein [Bifidobacteriaceae bacterium]